ncbi:MAG: kynureninase [Puia sp.]|nr:kynureninase [Puia sp.]
MAFEPTLSFARQKDAQDPLKNFRTRFHLPQHGDRDAIYFCGNSLGPQPKETEAAVRQELADWRHLAVGGYLHAKDPWLYYQHGFRRPLAAIAGCLEEEVTVMNALTVNLHLLMLSFYHPDRERYTIIMEAGAFPSDQYAIETQVRFHGFDPEDAIVEVAPREGEKTIRKEDILETIERQKDTLALVLLGGINYYTGQLFDIRAITEAAHRAGAFAGWDLAHAIGNVHLQLHDWEVDFAVWCSYKYLNGGPGAVGGAYLHERWARDSSLIRLGGWWGNDEKTRFKMEKGFVPKPDASGWNQSTAQVFNMVALKASLRIFEEAGMERLLGKSRELTAWLSFLLSQSQTGQIRFQVITPDDPARRGAQLSLFFPERGPDFHEKLTAAGIIADYREPGVIRLAPAPLFNTFEEVYRFYRILLEL